MCFIEFWFVVFRFCKALTHETGKRTLKFSVWHTTFSEGEISEWRGLSENVAEKRRQDAREKGKHVRELARFSVSERRCQREQRRGFREHAVQRAKTCQRGRPFRERVAEKRGFSLRKCCWKWEILNMEKCAWEMVVVKNVQKRFFSQIKLKHSTSPGKARNRFPSKTGVFV